MNTDNIAMILVTFGGLFILGLIADLLGRHTPLPRVTLLIIAGVLIGPSALNWLPEFTQDWFPILTDIALAMIGFMLGKSLTKEKLSRLGRPIIGISLGVMLMTAILMFFGMLWLGAPIELALILAGIAPATAPAPVVDVVEELDSNGPYTGTLLGIVAVDDAWGMLLFSVLLITASIFSGSDHSITNELMNGLWELFGAVLLGILLGIPMAYLTSHIYPGKSTQAEALGLVLLCAGAAVWLEVSYILAAMTMGVIVANYRTKEAQREFDEIETFEWPLLILFFLLAGASLQIDALWQVGWLGIAYFVLRVLGRVSGSFIGTWWAQQTSSKDATCDISKYRWMGLAMLPHAGIPIGMALMAIQQFPHLQSTILAVILGSTILFELLGPPITRQLLISSGETCRSIT
jgi:Kef-type K+ transport system membrane component KefB